MGEGWGEGRRSLDSPEPPHPICCANRPLPIGERLSRPGSTPPRRSSTVYQQRLVRLPWPPHGPILPGNKPSHPEKRDAGQGERAEAKERGETPWSGSGSSNI